MRAMRAVTVHLPVTTAGNDSPVVEQNSAQCATVLAPRIQRVADIIAEARARRLREAAAR